MVFSIINFNVTIVNAEIFMKIIYIEGWMLGVTEVVQRHGTNVVFVAYRHKCVNKFNSINSQ